MAPRLFRVLFSVLALLTAVLAVPSSAAQARHASAPGAPLPSLATFTASITDGEPGSVRGIYAPGLFAHPIVQQPAGETGFISSEPDVLTQFRMTAQMGSIGLLAHNYLAGREFAGIRNGQIMYLIYGDGQIAAYVARDVLRYKALQPSSAYSAFIDLDEGGRLSAPDLFQDVYGRNRALVLQTCIEEDGLLTWGRLFVIAQPLIRHALPEFACPDCS